MGDLTCHLTCQSRGVMSDLTCQSYFVMGDLTCQSRDVKSDLTCQSRGVINDLTWYSRGVMSDLTCQSLGVMSDLTCQSHGVMSDLTCQSHGVMSDLTYQSHGVMGDLTCQSHRVMSDLICQSHIPHIYHVCLSVDHNKEYIIALHKIYQDVWQRINIYLIRNIRVEILYSISNKMIIQLSVISHMYSKANKNIKLYTILTRWARDYYATGLFLKRDYFMTS